MLYHSRAMFTCRECLEDKSFTEFSKDRKAKSGLSSRCKSCSTKEYNTRKLRKKNTPAEKECKGCGATKPKHEFGTLSYSQDGLTLYCKVCLRSNWYNKSYHLTKEQRQKILERQGHRCPICRDLLTGETKVVDHNHKTKRTRGILCRRCNVALGMLRDSPDAAFRASIYLEADLTS